MSIAGVELATNGYMNYVPCKGLASTLLWVIVANIYPRDVGAQICNPQQEWKILASNGGE
jgi:hypothetical protein